MDLTRKRRQFLQAVLVNYLETASPMRRYSTQNQLRAAAKKMADGGNIPAPVWEALQAAMPRAGTEVISRVLGEICEETVGNQ